MNPLSMHSLFKCATFVWAQKTSLTQRRQAFQRPMNRDAPLHSPATLYTFGITTALLGCKGRHNNLEKPTLNLELLLPTRREQTLVNG